MSVLLIQPEYTTSPDQQSGLKTVLQPSLGLGYLEGTLQQQGIAVCAIDLNIESTEQLKTLLTTRDIRIIGLTCYTYNYANMIKTAKYCRTLRPEVILVAGGVHATYDYKNLLKEKIDYVVRFEGELSFLALCRHLLDGDGQLSQIPGLVYTRDTEIYRTRTAPSIDDLDSLALPILHMEKYPAKIVPISTSRGCPGQCIYCSSGAYWGTHLRYRGVANILAEVYRYHAQGYYNFAFIDDTINVQRNRFIELCEGLAGKKLIWSANCRVANLTEDLLEIMQQAGCRGLNIGIESADPDVQKKIGKVIDLERTLALVRHAVKVGLSVTCGLILYHYCDTPDTIRRTREYGKKLQDNGGIVRYTLNTPFKGTPQYDRREELGIRITDIRPEHYDLTFPVIQTAHFRPEEMNNVMEINSDFINKDNLINYLKKMDIAELTNLSPDMINKIIAESNMFDVK